MAYAQRTNATPTLMQCPLASWSEQRELEHEPAPKSSFKVNENVKVNMNTKVTLGFRTN